MSLSFICVATSWECAQMLTTNKKNPYMHGVTYSHTIKFLRTSSIVVCTMHKVRVKNISICFVIKIFIVLFSCCFWQSCNSVLSPFCFVVRCIPIPTYATPWIQRLQRGKKLKIASLKTNSGNWACTSEVTRGMAGHQWYKEQCLKRSPSTIFKASVQPLTSWSSWNENETVNTVS